MNMADVLNVRVGDVKVPKLLPEGLYKFVLTGYKVATANNDNKTPYVNATFKAVDIVDTENDVDIDNVRTIGHKFWRTDNADKITIDFFRDRLELDVGEDSLFGELWEESLGCEVIGEVETGISKKGRPFSEITRFFKVEAA